jgi:hypothetical protein
LNNTGKRANAFLRETPDYAPVTAADASIQNVSWKKTAKRSIPSAI